MPRLDDFRPARYWRLGNRAAQLGLAVSLTLGLHYLASQPAFIVRRDLTETREHSLSLESLAELRKLALKSGPASKEKLPVVEVLVTLPRDVTGDTEAAEMKRSQYKTIHARMAGLLDAFAHESARLGPEVLRVADADLRRNAKLNTEIATRLRGAFDPERTAVVVRCGDRMKAVDAGLLFRVSQDPKGGPQLDAFRGEEALLSAILEVSDARRPIVYFTNNHGELDTESPNPLRGCSRWQAELHARRFEVRPLNLDRVNEVPADADLVVVAGPLAGMSAREADKLRRYLSQRSGRLLAMLEPGSPHGLDDLLYEWGVEAPDALAIIVEQTAKSPDGDTVVGSLPEKFHETVRVLWDTGLGLYAGRLRPVQPDPGAPLDDTLSMSGLFYTPQNNVWGERDYRRPPYAPDFDKGDLAGPLCLGVASERAVRVKGQPRITAGRVIVTGTSDIGADTRFEKGGNRHFLMSATNWLLNRDYLVNVPPRPLSEFKLNASSEDLAGLAKRYAMLPLGVALLGFLVHWWRRRT